MSHSCLRVSVTVQCLDHYSATVKYSVSCSPLGVSLLPQSLSHCSVSRSLLSDSQVFGVLLSTWCLTLDSESQSVIQCLDHYSASVTTISHSHLLWSRHPAVLLPRLLRQLVVLRIRQELIELSFNQRVHLNTLSAPDIRCQTLLSVAETMLSVAEPLLSVAESMLSVAESMLPVAGCGTHYSSSMCAPEHTIST